MMYPLFRELAAEDAPVRVPMAVTCRILNVARQPYYRWLKNPITRAEVAEAHLANAIFDAHIDDPEFGYRLVFDELRPVGHQVSDCTVWRICAENGWWSGFSKKRAKNGKAGPPVHDDLVQRAFIADAPNRLWLTDITRAPHR